jgi:hypothetical protein
VLYFKAFISFVLLDPTIGLILRINHERPSSSSGSEYSILCRSIVSGKPIRVPDSNFERISKGYETAEGIQTILELKVFTMIESVCNVFLRISWCTRKSQPYTFFGPFYHKFLPIIAREYSKISNTRRSNEDVSNDIGHL